MLHEKNLLFQDELSAYPLGASVMPNLESDVSQFWPFPLSSDFLYSYRTRFGSWARYIVALVM